MIPVKFNYASSRNGVIGHDNKLPWHLREDLQLFKEKTLFQTVMMGSKTFDSLPDSIRPLPNRESIIVTSQKDKYKKHGIVTNDPLKTIKNSNKPIWIIGGATVFEQVKRFCCEVHHTEVDIEVKGDTSFHMDMTGWDLIQDSGALVSSTGLGYRVRVYSLPLVLLPA